MNTRSLWVIGAAALVLAATGCGSTRVAPVPNVTGERLDVAKDTLDGAGLDSEVTGGGAFGVIVESHWRVCEQHPDPGVRAASVELIVARSCPGTTAPGRVPDVTGLRLDVAERELGARGLEYYVYDSEKVIIRSNWTVCDQYPQAEQFLH